MSIYYKKIKNGEVALWESGGGRTNTGESVIIADHNGYPKRAIEIKTKGELACGTHALVPVKVGDIIVMADCHKDKISVSVQRITDISDNGFETEDCKDRICCRAIDAAIDKAYDYHCRRPYYVKQVFEKQ